MNEQRGEQGYVTQIISRRVKPGRQDDYEGWLRERLMPALSRHEGFEGVTILRPGDTPSKEYVIIQRWADYEHLCGWIESDDRKDVLAESEPFAVSAPNVHKETGLEVWFQLPGETAIKPPPRYKMALLIWMVIAPLTLAANYLLAPMLKTIPLVPSTYVRAGVVVLVMTYLAMPFVRKLFGRWLDH